MGTTFQHRARGTSDCEFFQGLMGERYTILDCATISPRKDGAFYAAECPARILDLLSSLPECSDPHQGEYHWPDHPHYEALAQDHDEDDDEDDDDSNEREHEAAAVASIDAHDSDGYTVCDQGHEHWGLSGAAGLLIRHQGDNGQTRYLLQHRSPHVQHGNTWSTPGGAMGSGEVPEHAALREAREEMGELPGDLTHHHKLPAGRARRGTPPVSTDQVS